MNLLRSLLFLTVAASALAEEPLVSYYRDVVPVFKRNCNACHRPGKAKGQLELTSFAMLMKGGKHGDTLKPGDPAGSRLFQNISGDEPEMPSEGDPLSPGEVAVIRRWIEQGAKDDTPADAGIHKLSSPPAYHALPSVAALAWSPDGSTIAVAGYHEVLLHSADGERITGRLVGFSPSIAALVFSPDGKLLATAGGATSEYGEIQLWDVAAQKLVRSIRTSNDTVFGVSFSPDGSRVAVGCADKLVRVFAVADGGEVMKCDNHIDWVFATAFSNDGTRLVTGSTDKSVRIWDPATGRILSEYAGHTDGVTSVAVSPDGTRVVSSSLDATAKVWDLATGRLMGTYAERGNLGVTSVAVSPDGERAVTGSGDGTPRVWDLTTGQLLRGYEGHGGSVAGQQCAGE